MKTIFIDCNDQLDQVFARVYRPDDPKIVINTTPVAAAALPGLIDGYEVCLDDHSYIPTELIAQWRVWCELHSGANLPAGRNSIHVAIVADGFSCDCSQRCGCANTATNVRQALRSRIGH